MGKRLLLVEDEATLARAVTRLLRRRGHEVFLAGTCEEARHAEDSFSIGIFDVDLPDGDGLSLAEELLRKSVVRRAIFFSGTPDKMVRVRATALGAFVEKFRGFPELAAAIDRVLAGEQVMVAGADSLPLRMGKSTTPPPSGVRKPRRES
jgi:DNA-binding response OmpR family regulator